MYKVEQEPQLCQVTNIRVLNNLSLPQGTGGGELYQYDPSPILTLYSSAAPSVGKIYIPLFNLL